LARQTISLLSLPTSPPSDSPSPFTSSHSTSTSFLQLYQTTRPSFLHHEHETETRRASNISRSSQSGGCPAGQSCRQCSVSVSVLVALRIVISSLDSADTLAKPPQSQLMMPGSRPGSSRRAQVPPPVASSIIYSGPDTSPRARSSPLLASSEFPAQPQLEDPPTRRSNVSGSSNEEEGPVAALAPPGLSLGSVFARRGSILPRQAEPPGSLLVPRRKGKERDGDIELVEVKAPERVPATKIKEDVAMAKWRVSTALESLVSCIAPVRAEADVRRNGSWSNPSHHRETCHRSTVARPARSTCR
jgi:hypothetical protein